MTGYKRFFLPVCAFTFLLGVYSSAANSGPPSYYDEPKIVEDKIVELKVDDGDVLAKVIVVIKTSTSSLPGAVLRAFA